jgi:heavy metal translocating P-type ATPase
VVVTEHFRVGGMHCPSCAWLVERILASVPGVAEARVDYLTEIGSAKLDLRRTSREDALHSIDAAGYHAAPLDDAVRADPERLVLRLAVAGIAAMNAMMLAWVHYAELFGATTGGWKTWIGVLQAAITVPAVGYASWPVFDRALRLLRLGRLGMDTLLALGIAASLLVSLAGFVLPGADFYFEIPAMITTAALASRLVERTIRRAGTRRVLELVRPRAVRVRLAQGPGDEGPPRHAAVGALRAGERIVVAAGEEVPVDVAVLGPGVTVDEAMLTGEAGGLVRKEGATVLAGSIVVEGELTGEVLRPEAESAHAQVARCVLGALAGERGRAVLGDRIAAVFVPVIVLVALGTAVAHAWLGGHGMGAASTWLPAIAVLVVACPCAFSLAASAALGAGVLGLLRRGVLVREPRALEDAAGIDTVVFDKTGTLTAGEMTVREVRWFGEPEPRVLEVLAALESRTQHPAGRAIRKHLARAGARPAAVESVEEVPGLGVRATVGGEGFAAGAPGLFREELDGVWRGHGGNTFVLFGRVARPAGTVVLEDPLRDGVEQAVVELRERGCEVRLLSGDDPTVVARCATAVGIEQHEGRVMPAAKARRVKRLRASGRRVLYVGDGVNDAPALAAATAGLAMRHGAGLACAVAGFVAVRDDPRAASRVLDAATRLRTVLRQNYAWAIGYNALLVPVAAAGWLHPAFAALAMLCSSVTVLGNSARLLRESGPG